MSRRALRAHRLVEVSNQHDRGAKPIARRNAQYWCGNDHLTTVPFAADVEAPEQWLCHTCGSPAGPDRGAPPELLGRARVFPKTPYEFVMMRRTEAEADRLLDEAVAQLRERRRAGLC